MFHVTLTGKNPQPFFFAQLVFFLDEKNKKEGGIELHPPDNY
jgi:hypothetical protein